MKKVNLLWLALVVLAFAGCTSYDDTDGDWERSVQFAGPYRVNAVSFSYTDPETGAEKIFIGGGYNSASTIPNKSLRDFWVFTGNNLDAVGWSQITSNVTEKTSDGRDTIVSKGNYPDTLGREGMVAFVIGDKAYVGAGYRRGYNSAPTNLYFSDFYAFDLKEEKWVWDQKANGHKRYSITDDLGIYGADTKTVNFAFGVGFAFDGKGYVGTGRMEEQASSTFYVFDPETEKWSYEPSDNKFPGDACEGANVFDFGDEIYVCLGTNGSTNVRTVSIFNGQWRKGTTLNPNLPGAWNEDYDEVLRSYAQAFVSDKDPNRNRKIAYVMGGVGASANDNWQYDRERDRWERTNRFSAAMANRVSGVGFTYNGYGYITVGGPSTSSSGDNTTWKFYPGLKARDWNDY